jgi:multiphosphoryl transfer protein
MALVHRFLFPLPNGLHARPASHFHETTSRFQCVISIVNERNGQVANAKSVLAMIGADVLGGDPCRIEADGADQEQALSAVRAFVTEVLPHCDPAIESALQETEQIVLPRSLRAAGLNEYLQGTPAVDGIGWGQVVHLSGKAIPAGTETATSDNPAAEKRKVAEAIAAVNKSINSGIERAVNSQEAAILGAHAAIVTDVGLVERINENIDQRRLTAAAGIVATGKELVQTLSNSTSAYLRQRVLDVQDVFLQLLDAVLGYRRSTEMPALTHPSICCAGELTPSQFLALDRKNLRGLVLCVGARTSHTVILARSMNIPTVVGVEGRAAGSLAGGQEVVVDGGLGLVIPKITNAIRRYYERRTRHLDELRRRSDGERNTPTVMADGVAITIRANIAVADEAAMAIANGAAGIGLFRTEMLFMDRAMAPSEQEQVDAYATAAWSAGERSVVIRLVDIGGDKPISYLDLPKEENPFLGFRGARVYGKFAELVNTQLRAILRAAAMAPKAELKILVPMISCVEEVRAIKTMLAGAAKELGSTRVPPLGVMIEVPSAALMMPELSREVDFFSIGSNDLIQYLLAADRGNPNVASLYTWSHPAFLRILRKVVEDARTHGKAISLCGEMGDSMDALPLLIGTGLTEISLSWPRIGRIGQMVRRLRFDSCRKLLEDAAACATRAEVETLLQQSAGKQTGMPLLSVDLVINSDGNCKAEVIKDLTDALHLAGRVDRPGLLEEKIWKREDVYSTGFGHGFAVPHCKSTHLLASSIVIARLSTAVDWASLDEKPVNVIILLAISEHEHGQRHMQIFSRLSRLAMRDEFRQSVSETSDPAKLVEFLQREIGS